ncbi:hypothetical protein BDV10DRAFT_165374 [Aspergillus recurvatus]
MAVVASILGSMLLKRFGGSTRSAATSSFSKAKPELLFRSQTQPGQAAASAENCNCIYIDRRSDCCPGVIYNGISSAVPYLRRIKSGSG